MNRTNSLGACPGFTSLISAVLLWIKGKQEGTKGWFCPGLKTAGTAELSLFFNSVWNSLWPPFSTVSYSDSPWENRVLLLLRRRENKAINFTLPLFVQLLRKQAESKVEMGSWLQALLLHWAWYSCASWGLDQLLSPCARGPFNTGLHPHGSLWGEDVSVLSSLFFPEKTSMTYLLMSLTKARVRAERDSICSRLFLSDSHRPFLHVDLENKVCRVGQGPELAGLESYLNLACLYHVLMKFPLILHSLLPD